MKKWVPYGGLILLLVAFLGSAIVVSLRTADEFSSDIPVIRFAHWQLESGLREAFDEIARSFEALERKNGREVKVIQTAVPSQIYASWSRTQLIGGTAPEIMMLPSNDELLARYFKPLTEVVDAPNPFNASTPLEGYAWRETFLDGLQSPGNFNERLLENYSIPFTVLTVRVFYNSELLANIVNDPVSSGIKEDLSHNFTPETFESFILLCHAIRRYAMAHNLTLVPLAGSRTDSKTLLDRFQTSQTQRLLLEIDQLGQLRTSHGLDSIQLLKGSWSLETPAVRDGLSLIREIGLQMPVGFFQMGREDALFYFAQERAVMMVTGAWDAPSLQSQAGDRFTVRAFPLPLPSINDETYGQNMLGLVSEAGVSPFGNLGVLQGINTQKQELAIRFLQYLTSYEGNQRFSQLSSWLPALHGVPVEEMLEPLMPQLDGYPPGIALGKNQADLERVLTRHQHVLFDPEGSVDDYIDAVGDKYREEVRRWLFNRQDNRKRTVQQQDSQIAILYALTQINPEELREQHRLGLVIDGQQSGESEYYFIERMRRELAE